MYYEESTVVLYWMKLSWMVVWVLRKIYRCIILIVNYHEWLYEYYEGSIVLLYWTLTVMNGWISNTKGTVVLYWMLNCYGMFVYVLQRIYYRVTECLNEIIMNVCTSTMKGLLLCCGECQIVMNHLNKQIKGYYHVLVISQTTSGTFDWLTISFG
jgi:hypothetical protein